MLGRGECRRPDPWPTALRNAAAHSSSPATIAKRPHALANSWIAASCQFEALYSTMA